MFPSGGEYTAGEYKVSKDIKAGVYDVESKSDSMTFGGIQLNEGDKILGYELYDNNIMQIGGEGTVELTPAKEEPLTANENGEIIIEHSGYYSVGSQIEPGTYEMSYRTIDESGTPENLPWVQITNENGRESVSTYSFGEENGDNYSDFYTIELKEGQTLQVMKSMNNEPISDVEIVLKKVE